jgi:hypothetical protein
MRKQIISLALLSLVAYTALSLPVKSWAGSAIVLKGSTLVEDTINGLLTIPYMEIQVSCWGVAYSGDDLLVYEPSMRTCSIYEDSLVSNLPDPDGIITLSDGRTGTLAEILEDELFVIIDTAVGIGTVDVMDHFAATVPLVPQGGDGGGSGGGGDTTPPNTTIIGGPSGTITDNDVIFTYTGLDNKTPSANLLYSHILEAYEANWSSYTSSTSKSYSDLPNGSYTFQVRAKDEAGKVDLSPASLSFTVDYTFLDSDVDGIPDDIEDVYCTDFNNPDTDNDSIYDGVEDANQNGIVDAGETNPCNADTDGDGIADGWEVANSLDPLANDASIDSDGDGYNNLEEYLKNTDPNDPASHPVRAMPWMPLLLDD